MKFRKITALLLVLCMLLSLSISVFAAEADEHTIYDSAPDEETAVSTEAATSGTIQNSSIRWSLDSKGWLTISGSGEAPVFTSAEDQPWAAVREQITEVWFEDVRSSLAKYRLVMEYGLCGIGYWNFMRPFTAGFALLNAVFRLEP